MTTFELIAQLADASDTARACAAYNLGLLGETAAVPALLGLLKSRKAIDRRAATLALGKIGSAEALAGVQKVVNDTDAVVQRFADEAIVGMRGNRAA